MKILIICIAILIIILAARRGYRRGLTAEIRMFVDVLVAILCLVLIILLRRAVGEHTYATVIVAAGGLVILGLGWKFIKLISGPLSGFKSIGIVRATDAFLGAVLGIAEGAVLIWIILWALENFGIIASDMIGILNI